MQGRLRGEGGLQFFFRGRDGERCTGRNPRARLYTTPEMTSPAGVAQWASLVASARESSESRRISPDPPGTDCRRPTSQTVPIPATPSRPESVRDFCVRSCGEESEALSVGGNREIPTVPEPDGSTSLCGLTADLNETRFT